MSGPEKGWFCEGKSFIELEGLTSETVQGSALSFHGIDYIHGGDSLPLVVLGVGDGFTDNILEKNFQDNTGIFVDEARDRFNTPRRAWRRIAGLVIPWMLSQSTLRWRLASPFPNLVSSLSAPRHDYQVSGETNDERGMLTIEQCLMRTR